MRSLGVEVSRQSAWGLGCGRWQWRSWHRSLRVIPGQRHVGHRCSGLSASGTGLEAHRLDVANIVAAHQYGDLRSSLPFPPTIAFGYPFPRHRISRGGAAPAPPRPEHAGAAAAAAVRRRQTSRLAMNSRVLPGATPHQSDAARGGQGCLRRPLKPWQSPACSSVAWSQDTVATDGICTLDVPRAHQASVDQDRFRAPVSSHVDAHAAPPPVALLACEEQHRHLEMVHPRVRGGAA